MRRVGGFKSVADLETFSQELKKEEFYVNSKPFGKLKYLEVSSENLQAKLYLREAYLPDKHGELTAKDETLIEVIKAKYPYEGIPKARPSC